MKSEMIITIGEGKKVNAEFNGFTIHTDQAKYAGGEGSAPEPFALFLASIGTCAGIFVSSFCQSRGIPTEGVRIVQSHFAHESGRGIGKIELSIELPPGFPEKYKHAVISAANLCAVKKHIMNPPEFVVTAVTR
jgi:putative redox protein